VALSSPACLRGGTGPERFPCPCCGNFVFGAAPGSHEICPVCFWEDDAAQLREPTRRGANAVTLAEAQRNFAELGACEARVTSFVRAPAMDEPRDPLWRPIDPARDTVPEQDQRYYWRTPSSTRAST